MSALAPFVSQYIATDTALRELVTTAKSPLGRALLALCDCMDGRILAREALTAAQDVELAGEEPHAVILLLAQWARLSSKLGGTDKARALLHQASELTASGTHPAITAARLDAEAVVAGDSGDLVLQEQHLRAALAILPDHSLRRPHHLWELLHLLCCQGRAGHSAPLMRELDGCAGHALPRWQTELLHFIDAVETGRIGPAASLSAQLAAAIPPTDLASSGYGPYHSLLELMQRTNSAPLIQAPPYPRPRHPPWLHVPYLLLRRTPREALRAAREDAQRSASAQPRIGFAALNLIRAELACGNSDAAERLLQQRSDAGNSHYTDPLFQSLIAYRKSSLRRARHHFAEVLQLCERNGARGRLDFEMALIQDLAPSDIAILAGGASSLPDPATPGEAPTPETMGRPHHTRGIARITGRSNAAEGIRRQIRQYAAFDAPILITGETGTGKEIAAKAIHEESSRAGHPFVAVNCSALPEPLLESELFGHEKGAFTGADRAAKGLFADAGEGTILLDEIGEIPPRLQSVLLRVLESGDFRAIGSSRNRRIACRVIAATNADLHARVATSQFRQDLLYRLERLRIHMAPLRERTSDIMLLAREFLDEGRPDGIHARVSRLFVETVRSYEWPGNVRELRNVIERMRLTHSDKLDYTHEDLDIKLRTPLHASATVRPARISLPAGETASPPLDSGQQSQNVPGPERPQPSPAPSIPSVSARTPLRRRQRLQKLFLMHRVLTRNEVIRLLEVSPNTATADLKALCEQGLIRRVTPTASTRTHYFERAD